MDLSVFSTHPKDAQEEARLSGVVIGLPGPLVALGLEEHARQRGARNSGWTFKMSRHLDPSVPSSFARIKRKRAQTWILL